QPQPQPQTTIQPQTNTQPEHQPQTTPKPQTTTQPQTNTQPKPKPHPQTSTQPQTNTQPQPQHQTLAPLPSWSLCLKGTPSVRNAEAALLLFCHSSKIAIDNKIEQAMDLVKSHLMLAVREEEELLRKRINQLSERNAQLERENYILRALRDRQRH
uniref:Uncharacterized protein n=1 Tax=Oncorhynchus tshawytscha TaxID=74940 RepID=A0AAZ3PCK2_ONCTS